MSAGKRISLLLLGVWFLFSGICACKQESSRSQGPRVKTQTTKSQTPEPSTAQEKDSQGPWPYTGKEEEKQDLAENLTVRNFVVVFDGSGSMSETKCAGGRTKSEVAKEAFKEWSNSVPQDAHVGLVSFNRGGWSQLPLARYDRHYRQSFLNVIQRISPGGGTPLAEALTKAYDMLTPQARKQVGYGEYNIVVVTDGIANDPAKLVRTVNDILASTPIVIHTIGFCIGEKHSLNQRGRTYYKMANDPAALRKGLQEVLAEAESFDVSGFNR
jgi:uncharacterized protein YegL